MEITTNKSFEILSKVCNYTGYVITFENDFIICSDANGSNEVLSYSNVEEALIDWLPTMLEQFEGCEKGKLWKDEIAYTKEIKKYFKM